jgi:hypothetical protein
MRAYQGIRKSSNELAAALSEQAWAALMAFKLGDAIGAALNLGAGGMRKTFAPEGPMVMAMALNELCQYPESVSAIQAFRKSYESSFRWLSAWAARREPLYPKAAAYLRRQEGAPVRVAGEWVRSPLFLASQDEINLALGERASAAAMARAGASPRRGSASRR